MSYTLVSHRASSLCLCMASRSCVQHRPIHIVPTFYLLYPSFLLRGLSECSTDYSIWRSLIFIDMHTNELLAFDHLNCISSSRGSSVLFHRQCTHPCT